MSLKPTAQGVIIPTTSVQMNPTTSKGRLPLPMKKKTNALKYDKQSDKRSTDLTQFVQPISITVDTFKNDSDVYLAFSLHYFNDATAARENTVKFMKMSSLEIDPVLILHEIRYSANEYCAKKIRFPSLVTSNPEIAQYFHEVGIIDRSYDCYFSHITKFADELLKIPEFEIALDVLENFFMGVKNDNNFQMQIQKYFIANKTHFDFPKIQLKKWTDVSEFLSDVLQYHQWMAELSLRSVVHKAYIDEIAYDQLMILQPILACLNSSVKELSKSDSYVSQVIPQLVRIQKLILKDLGNETLSKQLEAAFLKTLDPLLHGYQNGIYDLATFLDPRYSLETDILSYDKWQELAEFTKNYIMNSSIGSRLSNREKKSKIDVEMYNFQSIVKKQRPATHPFNWWKVYSKRFAFLYDVAKTFITPPPCAIDVQQYFGANGKYIRNESKLPLKQFNNNLMIAASLETFRGRGYTDKYNELEPIAINQGLLMNIHQAVKTPVIKRKNIDTSNAIVSVTQSYIIQTSNPAPASAPVLPNAETLDPDEGFDLSKYLMQPPDVKQEQFNEIGLSAEVKPESLLIPSNEEDLVDVKPERIEITPSTSTATHVKPKSIYVSTLGASPTYTREIQRAADKRVFIKVPVEEQPTNVSIDFVPSTSGQPRQVKRTYDSVPTTQGIVIESKKRYKRVCTNFETENGVICKERIYPFSTPTSLESITIARPQKIRNTPTGIYPNADL